MSCTSIDIKAYFFGELGGADRHHAEDHIAQCPSCREEFDRLRLTRDSLIALREEEIPRKIAFVSDKVFEARWWQRLWRSGPVMGFASALVLAAAILAHGYLGRPAVTIAQPPPTIDRAALEKEFDQKLEAAIAKAVADSETKTAELITASTRQYEQRVVMPIADDQDLNRKKMAMLYKAVNNPGGGAE